MSLSESDIQRSIYEYLVWNGHLAIRVNQGGMKNPKGRYYRFTYWQALGYPESPDGVADILGVTVWGQFYAIECKAPGKKATVRQEEFLTAVRDRGGLTLVADSLEKVERWLEKAQRVEETEETDERLL